MKQWYEQLFENYALTYDREQFTQGTVNEVDFIEKEINNDRNKKILDIGCGTGRHSVELAKRGYRVVGIDLSDSQLRRAREKAEEAGVTIDFRKKDARLLNFNKDFDVVLMLCEGGFPLMETDEMNFAILQNAAKALKSGGIFIMTTLNALFPFAQSVDKFINSSMVEGKSSRHSFDTTTLRDISTFEITDDSGNIRTLQCNERYYMPSEINWLLKSLKFINIGLYGCETGNFNKDKPPATDDYEILVVAKKS